MRSSKGSRRIQVGGVEYRWRATGNDGYICIGIWPANDVGPYLRGNIGYRETWMGNRDGTRSSAKDQIVVTSRIIRRIIDHATSEHHYDPNSKGKELNLKALDEVIKWDDAVRGNRY